MRLREAVATAAGFCGKDAPFNDIVIEDNFVSAWNMKTGVRIPVEDADPVKLVLAGDQLLKAVKALKVPKLTKGKGASVLISEGETEFVVKGKLVKHEPPMKMPTGGWCRLPSAAIEAIKAAAALVEPESKVGTPALAGLHIADKWIVGATNHAIWVVWYASGLPSITIDPKCCTSLQGECEAAVSERLLVFRDAVTGQVQWSNSVALEYPTASIDPMITASRDRSNRTCAVINPRELLKLCKIAAAAMSNPADWVRMEIGAGKIKFVRNEEFRGEITAQCYEPDVRGVHLNPTYLADLVSLCVEEDGEYYLSVGEGRDMVALWGGKLAPIEAILAPIAVS